MEAEKAEASWTYENLFQNCKYTVGLSAVVAFGYCCLPVIVNQLHGFFIWFDWFTLVLRNLFFLSVVVSIIIFLIYVIFSKIQTTEKKEPDLYDQYVAAVPPPSTVTPFDSYNMSKFEDVGYYNNSTYRENVPAFQAVKAVEESSYSYDQEVVEMSSKSYRRTSRSEKKMTERMVEYRKTETERVTKTGSWRSQSMDGLSSGEEFRRTIKTFVSEQKKMHIIRASGVDDQLQNGYIHRASGVDDRVHYSEHDGVPQWWQNGSVSQLQNSDVPQWQNGGVSQLQNGVHEPQNGIVQWQGSRDDGSGRHRHRHGHRSRKHRLEGCSGSKGLVRT